MLEKGKRIPNWQVKDLEGNAHQLWDYRQKSHLLLLFDPKASTTTLQHWQKAVQIDQKQWDWLNAKIIIIKNSLVGPRGLGALRPFALLVTSGRPLDPR